MRILFLGSSEFAIPTFDSIMNDGHDIVVVVTQPDRARGRGRRTTPTPVKAAAQEAGIPVLSPESVNAPDVVDRIKEFNADLAYVAAFGQMIGRKVREICPAGIINLHPSLLPAYRGAAPIQWAVINGDRETGVTVMRLVKEMDAGPMLVQRRTAIAPDETAHELHDRLARIGCDAVREAIKAIEADPNLPGEPQDPAKVTFAPKLNKEDGHIKLDEPVEKLARRVCGLWSWPGAMCRFRSADGSRDEVVTLARAVPYEGKAVPAASPDDVGRVTDMMAVQGVDRELTILEIKPAGGKLMEWRAFVNGRHIQPGDRFLPIEPD
ncbi:MAG: methionyl-tRNA formyltransferase [Phycisphaerae bacterium]|nr:methionyl-tRNA formyltransferase [Phycisphaerae bacterium]